MVQELQVNWSTFYVWYHRCAERGELKLQWKRSAARRYWNRNQTRVWQWVGEAALAASDPAREWLAQAFVSVRSQSADDAVVTGVDRP